MRSSPDFEYWVASNAIGTPERQWSAIVCETASRRVESDVDEGKRDVNKGFSTFMSAIITVKSGASVLEKNEEYVRVLKLGLTLQGIRNASTGKVAYAQGCERWSNNQSTNRPIWIPGRDHCGRVGRFRYRPRRYHCSIPVGQTAIGALKL